MRRDEVVKYLRELPKLRMQVEVMEQALESLTEEEEYLLDAMLIRKQPNCVENLCEKFEIERAALYKRRNKALKKLGDFLESW